MRRNLLLEGILRCFSQSEYHTAARLGFRMFVVAAGVPA
jgi:hypothetical protein